MTRHKKITVSLPSELVGEARRAVRFGRAPSVSAYVAQAIEQYQQQRDLATLLDEMLDETGGPLTDEERAQYDAELHG